MSKTFSVKETAQWLTEHDNYLVLTHIRPDGDTLGCGGGLTQGLRDLLGKTVYMMINTGATENYKHYVEKYWAPDGYKPDYIIIVDTASTQLIPENAAQYIENISLCIDHHESNTRFAQYVCCESSYASCGEIIYEILSEINAKNRGSGTDCDAFISKETADCLYVAVSTDTGCFAYGNTTANSHSVAAALIDSGADYKQINKRLFRTRSRSRITLEGMIYSEIEFLNNGKVAIIAITGEMMETSEAGNDDIDDISNLPISIEGVEIGITIREMTSVNDCKISIRTNGAYNASDICKRFGGGGHKAAAGASIAKNIAEIKKDLLKVLEEIGVG